jgi:hypothetical protein
MKSDSSETATAEKRLLDGVRSPADIKALSEQDLPQLAQEVRDELIKVLSQTGGHLGPNLGVVAFSIHRAIGLSWMSAIKATSTKCSLDGSTVFPQCGNIAV